MQRYNRFREDGDYKSYQPFMITGTYPGGGTPLDPGFGWPALTRLSRMWDNKTTRARDDRTIRPMLHQKWAYEGTRYPTTLIDHGWYVIPQPGVLPEIDPAAVANYLPFPDGSLLDGLNESAFNAFSARFPEQVSFPEFALGLRELKALLPEVQETVQQSIASGFLVKKFGWDNLTSDLRKLGALAANVEKRMIFLRESYGKPTTLHFYRPNVHSIPNGVVYERRLNDVWGTKMELMTYRCDYRATTTLLQYLEHLNDVIGYVRAFSGALGLNNPLKAVWVNLPGSFIIDWFIDVSKALDRLATIQPAEVWNTYNTCYTLKQTALFRVGVVDQYASPWKPFVAGSTTGTLRYTAYRREVGLPLTSDFIVHGVTNPDQLLLLAALAFANTRHQSDWDLTPSQTSEHVDIDYSGYTE